MSLLKKTLFFLLLFNQDQPAAVEALPVEPGSAVVDTTAAAAVAAPAPAASKAPLSAEEMARKRAQVCQEVVETEERYLAQLQLIVTE